MKNRAALSLMEQLVMLLVFSLAAAICLQAFVRSNELSVRNEARDRALTLAQSAAETVRGCGGDLEAAAGQLGASEFSRDGLTVFYGTDWQPSAPLSPGVYPFGYTLGVGRLETGVPGLGKASVWVQEDETGRELIRLEIAWQEGVDAP